MTTLKHALNVRSDFSIGESLLQLEHIIEDAKKHGYESVALCDTMSLHQMVDFSSKAKKAGLKPIVGVRLRVYDDPFWKKPGKASGIPDKPNPSVTLRAFITGPKGLAGLFKLLSKANTPEQFYYHARTGWEDVMELEDVIITTGDFFSLWHHPQANDRLDALVAKFGKDRVYADLVPVDTPLWDTLNAHAIEACLRTGIAPVVSPPFLYRDDAHAETLEVLNAICTQTKMSAPWRSQQWVRTFSMKPPADVAAALVEAAKRWVKYEFVGTKPASFANEGMNLWMEALRTPYEIAALCSYEWKKFDVSLPKMADNEFMELGRLCLQGWARRFSRPVLGHQPTPAELEQYKERLHYELGVLKKMGFSAYFLLVRDLVSWAKGQGILVGPGRGSVGGSLVAYLLGITDVDPIRFQLLFERFINPERLDLPDADLDFQTSRRHEVFQYLQDKYGKAHVAGVSNFNALGAKSALRDTGRIHDMSPIELMATKLVPQEHGISFSLTEAAKSIPEIDKFRTEHPMIWKHALALEGATRSFGQHAAGVVVAAVPLIERAVIETRSDENFGVVSWDKRVVEDYGLVKMDVLGLSTLDVLDIAKRYIKDRHGIDINYLNLPLEEPDVMDAFGKGHTTGVFQFESPGMRKLLKDLAAGGPLTFEDITAATALYRPGPMDSGLLDDFVAIKQGFKTPFYEHPNMEAALASTYSVIVYQEQVMQLAVDLAGFTRAQADHLRKAMGKKDKDKMAAMRDQWIKGCDVKSGMGRHQSEELFDKIEAFAGYGFNRSHAVEYSIISYWTMWLSVRYPAEYFAACLSIVGDDKLTGLVKDARDHGIEVLPPDCNASTDRFTIPDDKHLLAPFNSVKGISENTAHRIMELRAAAGGKFTSEAHFDSVLSVKGSKVTVRHRENLKLVGALCSLDPTMKPARHPDRRKDQTELMPGLIIDTIKADRTTDMKEPFLRAKVIHLVQEYRKCAECDLAGQPHPQVRTGGNVKFMVVTDCPSWQEEKMDKLLEGDIKDYIRAALEEAGLKTGDGYFTTLVKAKKNDKFLTNGQINGCAEYLNREIALIKPAVIVALGSAAVKRFIPGAKPADMVGKAIYDSHLDATIVCGLNVQQITFDPGKMAALEDVFKTVAEIVT